jgi:hypothetical protein
MPSSYTSNLRLTLPATGELSGTWGTTVNTGITSLVDTSIAGTASITMTAADYTLSSVNGGADEARSMILSLGGTPGGSYNVICPAVSKLYVVVNATGHAQTVKTSLGTGISVPDGKAMLLRCNGTDVVDALTNFTSLAVNNIAVATLSASQTLTNKTINGPDNNLTNIANASLANSSVTIGSTNIALGATSTTLAGLTGVTSSAFTNSSLTSGRVVYSTTGGAQTDSANLTFNGTTLSAAGFAGPLDGTVGATTPAAGSFTTLNLSSTATLSAGTANGVTYLNASKVVTSGTSLVFDGTNLGIGGTPSALLHVQRATDGEIARLEGTSGTYASFGVLGGATYYNSVGGTGTLVWQIAGAEQMRLTTAGLGVGTTNNPNSSTLFVDGTISETVGTTQYLVASQYDIGSDPNEIPLNGMLGTMAYQDDAAINVGIAQVEDLTVSSTAALPAGTVISGSSSSSALRITQTGSGDALVVEDSANPDSTPFIVKANGQVGIGQTFFTSDFVQLSVEGNVTTEPNSCSVLARTEVQPTNTTAFTHFQAWLFTKDNGGTPYTVGQVNFYSAQQVTISPDSTIGVQRGFYVTSTFNAGNTNIAFHANNPAGSNNFAFRADSAKSYFGGDVLFNKTITAAGTTGAQTIDKNAGSVNFAAADTSLVVTNSLVTANSVIIATVATNDATMTSVQAVAGAGSFTLYANAAATAETRVNFLVIN